MNPLSIVLLLVAILVVVLFWKRNRELRMERDSFLGALKRERAGHKITDDRLTTLIASRDLRIASLSNELTKIKQDYEPSLRLSAKLNTARATGDQQDERLKHQNNEMRVMMNRLHRHLSGVSNGVSRALRATHRAIGPDLKAIESAADGALKEWHSCNDWLSANKIEPYQGSVPGYDGKTTAEREKEVASAS